MPSLAKVDAGRARVAGRLGLLLPTFPQHRGEPPASSQLGKICRRAEIAGADALWACDHIFWHTPALECFAAVSVAATATERAAIGSCVLQLPLRQPAVVAKQAASLQGLSGGRFVLGVGIGTHRGEYEAAGVSFEGRGRRLDSGISALRDAWSSADGNDRYRQLPAVDPVPIWVGGSSEAALRRAARVGDGWIPLFVPADEYAVRVERLQKEAERTGRDPAEICRAIVVFVAMGESHARDRALEWMSSLYSLDAGAFRRHLIFGNATEAARSVSDFYEAGADHVAIFVASDEPIAQFEDLTAELAELRGARP